MTLPPCPCCKTNRHASTHGQSQYYCSRCGGLYDNDPDEGGDHSTFNPAARLEREERRKERQMRP